MEKSSERIFLDYSAAKLDELAGRIVDCLGRLEPAQIWARAGENENAVGNLVLHLCGNVRQWIVAGIGGAADVRDRAREFAARGGPAAGELAAQLKAGVAEVCRILGELPDERLRRRVCVQGYDLTVLEAIYLVVEHFAQHAGQIIYATKRFTGADLGYYRHLDRPQPGEPVP